MSTVAGGGRRSTPEMTHDGRYEWAQVPDYDLPENEEPHLHWVSGSGWQYCPLSDDQCPRPGMRF